MLPTGGTDPVAEGGSNLARERSRQYTLQEDLKRAEAQLKDMPKNDKQRRAAQEKKIAGLREELRGSQVSISILEDFLASEKKRLEVQP